jgi:hypothetical protein
VPRQDPALRDLFKHTRVSRSATGNLPGLLQSNDFALDQSDRELSAPCSGTRKDGSASAEYRRCVATGATPVTDESPRALAHGHAASVPTSKSGSDSQTYPPLLSFTDPIQSSFGRRLHLYTRLIGESIPSVAPVKSQVHRSDTPNAQNPHRSAALRLPSAPEADWRVQNKRGPAGLSLALQPFSDSCLGEDLAVQPHNHCLDQ